ncbi:hypothetical protein [Amorphus orientalis]|uniref:Uncharacterized protein n=1 Tax=Amorphus orientalis TaxID=649198 RepID=A0AAE3VNF2_9HYPH|nr:hypothetical protein [Amorphus orientalis]MDQ0314860.1 hypothetical protein [Amorphus orientalis]
MTSETTPSVTPSTKKLTKWTHTLDYPFAVREVARIVDGAAVTELERVEIDEAQDKDRKVVSLTFRRMRAGDPKLTEGIEDPYASAIATLATLAGEPSEVIDMLDFDDFEAINEGTVPLMGKSAMKLAEARKKAEAEAGATVSVPSGAI